MAVKQAMSGQNQRNIQEMVDNVGDSEDEGVVLEPVDNVEGVRDCFKLGEISILRIFRSRLACFSALNPLLRCSSRCEKEGEGSSYSESICESHTQEPRAGFLTTSARSQPIASVRLSIFASNTAPLRST